MKVIAHQAGRILQINEVHAYFLHQIKWKCRNILSDATVEGNLHLVLILRLTDKSIKCLYNVNC